MRDRDKLVGWWWNERAFYCTAHKPSPPDDVLCTPLMAGDCEGERCDACGAPLDGSVMVEATASFRFSQDKLDRLAALTHASHPTWTLQAALDVALSRGVEEMLDLYERIARRKEASRGSTHGAAVPESPNGDCP